MKNSTGLEAVISLAFLAAVAYGYVANIVKFCHCDFESPAKAEIIRGVGIIVAPVGVITGYVDIEDK